MRDGGFPVEPFAVGKLFLLLAFLINSMRHSHSPLILAEIDCFVSHRPLQVFVEIAGPHRSRRDSPDRALAGHRTSVSRHLRISCHLYGPHAVGACADRLRTAWTLPYTRRPGDDAAAAQTTIHPGVSSVGACGGYRMARVDFRICRGSAQPVLSILLFCAGGRSLPLGRMGDAGHGGRRGCSAMDREPLTARVDPRTVTSLARILRSEHQSGRV